jgi:hypothetical protein
MPAAESLRAVPDAPLDPDRNRDRQSRRQVLTTATQVPATVPTSVYAQCASRARPGRYVPITGRPGADKLRRVHRRRVASTAPRSAQQTPPHPPAVASTRGRTGTTKEDGIWLHLWL